MPFYLLSCVSQTVHFIRHGEGFHNIGFDGNEDAHLTPFGWSQAHGLHDHIQSLPTALGVQVRCLLISPSSRALIEHLPNQMLRNCHF